MKFRIDTKCRVEPKFDFDTKCRVDTKFPFDTKFRVEPKFQAGANVELTLNDESTQKTRFCTKSQN